VNENPAIAEQTRAVMARINSSTPGARIAEVPTLFAFGPIYDAIVEASKARAEVDKRIVADTLRTLMGAAAADPYVRHLERAINTQLRADIQSP
jgi:hypothetical protein